MFIASKTTACGSAVREFADGHRQRPARLPRGAFSANTERAVRADLGVFAAWCGECHRVPMPAKPETVAAFVDAMAATRAPATVRRYVASIAAAHRSVDGGQAARSARVKLALKRMHRRKGRRQAQARGLTWPLRERLIDAAGDRAIDDRNRALVAVAYDAMLRRSELADLQVDDLVKEIDGSGTLLVRRGKTDPEGRGASLYLAPDTVALVRVGLRRCRIEAGRLFRSVGKDGTPGEKLHPSQVPRIFKAMAHRAGLRRRSPTGCPATARAWARCRTWWRGASSCPRSCRRGAGRPRRW